MPEKPFIVDNKLDALSNPFGSVGTLLKLLWTNLGPFGPFGPI